MTKVDDAWQEFRVDMMTDPVRRYARDEKDIFAAGWKAAQRRQPTVVKESVWFDVPTPPDDDPE